MPRRGLGRGLDELIPSTPPELTQPAATGQADGLLLVPVQHIVPNPHQPRTMMAEDSLEELAASIKEHGVIQPLVVTRAPSGHYQLIAGERRWRAAQLAGLDEVPVIIKEAAPQQILELALVENIQRADLNPLEEALAYEHLSRDFNLSQSDIARRVGKSRTAVVNVMRLLNATPAVQQAIMNEEISEGHGRALLGLIEPDTQNAALDMVIAKQLTVRQTEALVRQLREPVQPTQKPEPSPEIRAMEERFQSALGTRVRLNNSEKGGQVVIYYYSDEEFRALYERLTGEDL